jgi:hypothetical protein
MNGQLLLCAQHDKIEILLKKHAGKPVSEAPDLPDMYTLT